MDNNGSKTLRTILILTAVVAVAAGVFAVLYRTERRLRRLVYQVEQNLGTKSSAMRIDL